MSFDIDQLKDLHQSPISSIEVKRRPSDAELVFTCSDEELKVTNLANRQQECLYKVSDCNKEELNSIKLFPTDDNNGGKYMFASNSQHLYLFELEKLKIASKFKFNKDTISCLELSKSGNCLACGDDSGEIKLLDIRTPQSSASSATLPTITLNRNLNAHSNICYALKFNPSNEFELFSAGFDCSIFKWDIRSVKKAGAKQHSFVKQINVSEALTKVTRSGETAENSFISSMTPCFVHCLDFFSVANSDSNLLMAGVESGACMLFDAKTCECVGHRQLQPFNCALTQMCAVRFNDDHGDYVAIAGNGPFIDFVTLKTEVESEAGSFQVEDKPELRLNHKNKINCLRYSDKKLLVADTTNGLTIYKYHHPHPPPSSSTVIGVD